MPLRNSISNSSKTILALLSCTVILAMYSCRKKSVDEAPALKKPPHNAEFLLADDELKDRWILKVSRKLRHGVEPSAEQLAKWHAKPPQEILNEILASPESKDGGLDFILYFLGFKDDGLVMPTGKPLDLSLSFDSTRSHNVASASTAIDAALALSRNEDFLGVLAKLDGRFYASPIPWGKTNFFGQDVDLTADSAKTFANLQQIRRLTNEMAPTGKIDPEVCKFLPNISGDINPPLSVLLDPFVSDFLFNPLFQLTSLFKCGGPSGGPQFTNGETPPRADLPPNFEFYRNAINKVADITQTYEARFHSTKYMPKKLDDLQPFDFDATDITPDSKSLARRWFWSRERNSSTNRNRKRSAYILKRFFCDDLTPLGVEVPAGHAGNQHASDPGCASCHYKLDPMAGFFRKIGVLGQPYKASDPFMMFDDFASTAPKEYFESWKATDGSYDIGYIRSRTDASLNSYPLHRDDPEFSDLVEILKDAPEVKRCLVKRTFQYMVGEEVAIDGGYQSELEKLYNSNASRTSSESLKEVIKVISLSYSFVRDTSDRGVCYDFPENYDPEGKPACEIHFIVEQNCAGSCHSKASAAGGLDMSSWTTPTTAGAAGGFLHKDKTGARLSYADSLGRIAERLNTADDSERMPLSKSMNPVDREALFLWTQSQLRSVK